MRLSPARNHDRPDDLQVLPRRLQLLHARFLNQIDERRGAAVHDRHFRRVQLDDDVVDAEADERGEQMLDRFDRHLVARETGRQLNAGKIVHGRRHLEIAEVGPAKTDAEVRRGGLERQIDLVTGVKPNSDAGNVATKSYAVRPSASHAQGDVLRVVSAKIMPAWSSMGRHR